ncbi:hypothetical protein A3765_28370 [Oleiphilus sp. HI0130]|nr:hypothetical protein A3765_28680 [Oleiphilus sp. HI0130]KZZ72467.1 hypothetical protein A3765_28370 [Oleiphilus sp. HI0130]
MSESYAQAKSRAYIAGRNDGDEGIFRFTFASDRGLFIEYRKGYRHAVCPYRKAARKLEAWMKRQAKKFSISWL